ncbi:ABC transporter substrate-binding protein [Caballeronia sp. GAWG2-1]|uniref:ABC transporter substrate-binding protein n=1 Tax=Caballeronia sp. GAWG2-1 TaxID=2921744 RepID=UPI00202985D8|nr:ABC transporter substrate-binding protein [Caballeronia sp. GAWG2-1]
MKISKAVSGFLCLASFATWAHADELVTVNYGGVVGEAQKRAWVEPFAKASGISTTAVSYTGDQAKIKAMTSSGDVTWDVVEIGSQNLGRGCQDGLYEKLDWSKIISKSALSSEAVSQCGAGIFVSSTVLAYNPTLVKGTPSGWKDFWDVKKFPGKRGMRKDAHYNLEIALMADGVPTSQVFKVLATKEGQDRAFRKLEELRPNIQWWEAGAQAPQFLAAGDVVMTTAWNGRISAAQKEGNKNLAVSWRQNIADLDFFVIPKGTKRKEAAEKFIGYSVGETGQKAFAGQISYGPVNKAALKALDTKTLENLPNAPQNAVDALTEDFAFWTDNGDALDSRFSAWASK